MTAVTTRDVVESLRRLRKAAMPFMDRAALAEPDFTLEEMRALEAAHAEATDVIATIIGGDGIETLP